MAVFVGWRSVADQEPGRAAVTHSKLEHLRVCALFFAAGASLVAFEAQSRRAGRMFRGLAQKGAFEGSEHVVVARRYEGGVVAVGVGARAEQRV